LVGDKIRSGTRVTDTTTQPKVSRWLIAAAIFGGVCNLSCVVLTLYQDYCRHYQLDSDSLILIAGSLAPLLVLFALRRVLLVVLIYVSTLFWILVQQVLDLQHGCLGVAKPFQKYSNEPAAILSFFGAFSIYVFLAWGAIRLVVLVWRKFDRAEP
jgi:hypothetical protein